MESCKEFLSRIVRSLIVLRAVRSLLGKLSGFRSSESCKEFVRRI